MNKYDDDLWHDTFLDFMEVVRMGAEKYEDNGWLEPDGVKTSRKDQYASINRHLSSWYYGETLDHESELHHLLHVMARCAFVYTRYTLDITHPDDEEV